MKTIAYKECHKMCRIGKCDLGSDTDSEACSSGGKWLALWWRIEVATM